MQVHVKLLAALLLALSAVGLLIGLVILIGIGGAIGAAGASGDPEAAPAIPIIGIVGMAVVVFAGLLGLPGLVAGVGLLYFKPWARVLGIVLLVVVSLVGFPWLTILGAYGLWVLLSKNTEHLFAATSLPPSHS